MPVAESQTAATISCWTRRSVPRVSLRMGPSAEDFVLASRGSGTAGTSERSPWLFTLSVVHLTGEFWGSLRSSG